MLIYNHKQHFHSLFFFHNKGHEDYTQELPEDVQRYTCLKDQLLHRSDQLAFAFVPPALKHRAVPEQILTV